MIDEIKSAKESKIRMLFSPVINFRTSFPSGKLGTFLWITTVILIGVLSISLLPGLIWLIVYIISHILEWVLIGLCFFAFLGAALATGGKV